MNGKKVAALGIAALGLYLVGLGVVGGLLFWLRRAEHEQVRRLVRLGEQQAPLAGPAAPTARLWKACTGKVPEGTPAQFAGYNAYVEPRVLPAMPEPEGAPWVLDESLVWQEYDILGQTTLSFTRAEVARLSVPSLLSVLRRELDPTGWPDHVRWGLERRALRQSVKVLVAARYVEMTPPKVDGDRFSAPTGTFLARVVDVESSTVLCEGRGELAMTSSVEAHGSGETKAEAASDAAERLPSLVQFVFTLAVAEAPVHEVCAQGHFCEATARHVSWPKDRPWKSDRAR